MSRPLKLAVTALCLAGAVATAAARLVIPDSEAGNHVGEEVTVRGTVEDVYTSRKGNTFLNFGARYPDQTFSGVIFRENASQFPDAEQWEGRRVMVHGRIQLYRGKPEVILRSPEQLGPSK